MPPRHAYWTIIVDDQPTSFRAHDVEELLPTFNRLREKHPNAQLKWFERGQLFDTRDAAREQGFGQGERRWEGPRPDRDQFDARDENPERSGGASAYAKAPADKSGPPPRDRTGPRRDKTWRPGGEHRDPRQKYKDAKKAKWDRYKQNLRTRWEEKKQPPDDLPPPQPDHGDHTPPHGDPIRPKLEPPALSERKRVEGRRNLGAPAAMRNERESRGDRPRDDRPPRPPRASERESRGASERESRGPSERESRGREWRRDDDRPPRGSERESRGEFRRDDRRPSGPPRDRDRGGWKPKGPPPDRDRGEWKPKGPPRGDRKPWGGKPGGKPGGARKPWGAKPAGGARKPWGAKPAGAARKPWGSKPAGARKPPGAGFRKKPFGSGPPRGSRPPKKRRDDEE